MMLGLQVVGSVALVVAVLWWMWRLPPAGEQARGWAPVLALAGAWMGLLGVGLAGGLWWMRNQDRWLAGVMLVLVPGAIASGVLVLWVHRSPPEPPEFPRFSGGRLSGELPGAVDRQRLQAKVAIVLGATAGALGYWFVMRNVG